MTLPNSYARAIVRIDGGDDASWGTGFIIHQDEQGTYILTCEHVVSNLNTIRVDKRYDAVEVFPFEKQGDTALSSQNDANLSSPVQESDCQTIPVDLAVLRCAVCPELSSRPVLPLGGLSSGAAELRALVFNENTLPGAPAVNNFRIELYNEDSKDSSSNTISLKNPEVGRIVPGNSGSPLVDPKTWNVVGVIAVIGGEINNESKPLSDTLVGAVPVRLLSNWNRKPTNLQLNTWHAAELEVRRPVRVLIAALSGCENERAIVAETLDRLTYSPAARSFPVEKFFWRPDPKKPGLDREVALESFHGVILIGRESPNSSIGTEIEPLEEKTRDLLSRMKARADSRLVYQIFDSDADRGGIYECRDASVGDIFYCSCTRAAFPDRFWLDLQTRFPRLIEISRAPDGNASAVQVSAGVVRRRNPYLGLTSYGADDAALFFGRMNEVTKLRDILQHRPRGFLFVFGPSGCGKSSLVQAGLRRRLDLDAIKESSAWKWICFSLSRKASKDPERPLRFFASTIHYELSRLDSATPAFDSVSKVLLAFESPEGLSRLASCFRDAKLERRLVIFIDQFEEVFTVIKDEDKPHRNEFLKVIHDLSRLEYVNVIVTVRDDYYARISETPLASAEEIASPYFPMPLDSRSLSQIIRLPARLYGFHLEDGLAEQIREDALTRNVASLPSRDAGLEAVTSDGNAKAKSFGSAAESNSEGEPSNLGTLPLVSFALQRLVAQSEDSFLTISKYNEIGGVRGAIQAAADEVLDDFADKHGGRQSAVVAKTVQHLFSRLIRVDREGPPTKLPVRFDGADETWTKDERDLKDKLVDKRLLSSSKGVISATHEALFTNWPYLQHWIEISRQNLILINHFENCARDWTLEKKLAQENWNKQDKAAEPNLSKIALDEALITIDRELCWPQERLQKLRSAMEAVSKSESDLTPEARAFRIDERCRLEAELEYGFVDHKRRAEIGDRLAQLPAITGKLELELGKNGDTRPGVGVRNDKIPDIAWCFVPGGDVSIHDTERNSKIARTVRPFYIAKYPITLGQFDEFRNSDAHLRGELWQGLAVPPWGRKSPEQNPAIKNRPAQYVSWYQAIAFCRWFSAAVGYTVRLPTEWEWVRAATGGDPDNIYPWGPDSDTTKASFEGGAYRLMSVGMYPLGKSPVGAYDMSGNMYEWCQNLYETPENTDLSADGPRTSRGGAWFSPLEDLKVTHRKRDNADGRIVSGDPNSRPIGVCVRLVADTITG